jgi:CubicO group peptidase (beta-lactamase class C family)
MLLNNGQLDDQRILGRKTVELMTTNHLAPELLPYEIGEIYLPGYGYGLGLRVLMDVGQSESVATLGEYGWAGGASTYFWIDPAEELIGYRWPSSSPPISTCSHRISGCWPIRPSLTD